MDLFKKIYLKEGKGIDKDQPEKRAFFRFWEIAWFKRYKLMAINLLYFVTNLIPAVLAAAGYIVAVAFYFTLTHGVSVTQAIEQSARPDGAKWLFLAGLFFVTGLFTLVPIFSSGPCYAGLTFITRSFVKREPVFLWTDFKGKTRSNRSLAIKVMLINALVGFVMMIGVAFYLSCSGLNSNLAALFPEWFLYIVVAVVVFAFFLFFSMNLYIYPMIVTFRLTLKQLYKNAMIFAIIRWLPNLGILLLTAACIAVPLLLISGIYSFIISLLLYVLLAPAFMSYLHTFYVYPTLKRYMIDNPKADKSQE